ncbi:MAG: hypothetical protein ACQEQV_09915, partial [Fibrobacterota bacterium]
MDITVLLLLCLISCSTHRNEEIRTAFIDAYLRGEDALDSLQKEHPNLNLDSLHGAVQRVYWRRNDSIFPVDTGRVRHSWCLGVHTPPNYSPEKKYPLIVYLHGGIQTQRSCKGDTAHTMMRFLYDSLPLFAASPSGNHRALWWEPEGIRRILYTVRRMRLAYPVDTSRIILCGVSDGGTAVFSLASLHNHPFSHFISVSGYPPLLNELHAPFNVSALA